MAGRVAVRGASHQWLGVDSAVLPMEGLKEIKNHEVNLYKHGSGGFDKYLIIRLETRRQVPSIEARCIDCDGHNSDDS